ncbi:PaaI family thioesterase [Amycolatopsis aidingensis]|uniref:PaaI family thioesterase n=1 Tax=Amycolatopsis aidingensis TaxID=2842453 RepID=UPI001E373DD8|nr:PaaI family thioesterase [Amycolatopsis aidingensis]
MDTEGTALFHRTMPFTERLGIEVLEHSAELVRTRVGWDESLCTLGGSRHGAVLHGGLLMALADATGAVCAFHNLPAGAHGTTTLDSATRFLRGVHEGHVLASSRPLHTGRTVIVVETELHDAGGLLVAKVSQTQAVLRQG